MAARTSGWRAKKPAGRGTPWIWWRSSQTLATERAAWVSSAVSAAARARGRHPGGLTQGVDHREVAGARWPRVGRAAWRVGTAAMLAPDLGLGPVGPARAEAVALALERRAPHEVADQRRGPAYGRETAGALPADDDAAIVRRNAGVTRP